MPGFGGVVGQNDDFTRARDHIDVHLAVDESLSNLNRRMTRPHEFVDSFDGFSAVGEGGHGLRAKHPVDRIDADDVGGGQYGRMDLSVWLRRRDKGEVIDSGHLCRDRSHQKS